MQYSTIERPRLKISFSSKPFTFITQRHKCLFLLSAILNLWLIWTSFFSHYFRQDLDYGIVTFKYSKGEFIVNSGRGWEERSENIVKMVYEAFTNIEDQLGKRYHSFAVQTLDSPLDTYISSSLPRVYFTTGEQDKLEGTVPDFMFEEWASVKISSFSQLVSDIHAACRVPAQVDKMFWSGARTNTVRERFYNLSQKYPQLMESQLIQWSGDWRTPNRTDSKFVKFADQARYSMLIDIEGNGYSGRIKVFAHFNRTLFIQERKWWDWGARGLKPWEHYIPVKNDFSDLIEKINWAKEHGKEVVAMNERRLEFAEKSINRAEAIKRFEEVLLEN